jgi:uncharacterized protein YndB with AHSA1/START domain
VNEHNTDRRRTGGEYEIVDRRHGIIYRAIGTFIEFDRPHRLAFTFAMPEMPEITTP